MHKVIVEKQCGCFRKSGHAPEVSFASKDEAMIHANNRKEEMNSEWCGKHNFFVQEDGDHLIIKMGE